MFAGDEVCLQAMETACMYNIMYIDNVIILYLKAYLVLCVCVNSFKELYTRGKWEVGWIPGNSGLVCECW